MRYQDFAVLTGDLSVYGTYAREIFEKCGVPYFVDEKHSVLMNPFVEFLRAAIEMVVQSFSYESVFRYLRCGLSSLNREETDAMENYVIALGIRGLKAYGETWTRGYRGIKPDEVPQRNLLREKFYAEVQPFAEQMKKKDATVRERTEALYALGGTESDAGKARGAAAVSLSSRDRRRLQKNTARFTALLWSFWIRSSRCWAMKK